MKKVLALLLLTLLLLGCAGGDAVHSSRTAAPEQAEAPAATAAPEQAEAPAATAAPEEPDVTATAEGTVEDEVIESLPPYDGLMFSTVSLTGETVDQSYLQNHKLTMVNFWATWCGPCVGEMPELAQLHNDYADKGFAILGVMIDPTDDVEAAKALIESESISYPIIPLADDLGELSKGIQAIPTTLFFDASGKPVGESQLGSRSYNDWAALVDSLLAGL